jgi:hypothetical protein
MLVAAKLAYIQSGSLLEDQLKRTVHKKGLSRAMSFLPKVS